MNLRTMTNRSEREAHEDVDIKAEKAVKILAVKFVN